MGRKTLPMLRGQAIEFGDCSGNIGKTASRPQTRAGLQPGMPAKEWHTLARMIGSGEDRIAAVIGGIIAYLVNNLWLQYMAKSVDFGIGIIITGVFIVVFIGLLTISSQTLKVAHTNPAETLKNE